MIYGNRFLNENALLSEAKVIGKTNEDFIKTDKKINGVNIRLSNVVKENQIEENLEALEKSFDVAKKSYKDAFDKFISWLDSDPNYPEVTAKDIIKGTTLDSIEFHVGNINIDSLKIHKGKYYEYEFTFVSGKGTNAKKVYDCAAFELYIDEDLKLQKITCHDI